MPRPSLIVPKSLIDMGRGMHARLPVATLPILLVAMSSVVIISQTTWQGVSHDLSSFLAPVVAITNGHFALYDAYFNVAPPGIHLILLPWVWLFGPGIWSMYALHSIFVFSHQGTMYLALRKWLTPIETTFVFVPTTIVTITGHVFDEMLLNTELVGNTFVLLGFCVLPLRSPNPKLRRWAVGLSLLTFAVVVREVYLFAPVMAFGAFLWIYRGEKNQRPVTLKLVAWAAVLGAGPTVAMLMTLEGLGPYFRVLHLKRVLFPWPDYSTLATSPLDISWTFVTLWPALLLPVAAAAASVTSIRRRQPPYILLFCAVGVGLVGVAFAWQGKPASGHYLASLLPPIAGLLAISLTQFRPILRVSSRFAVLLLLFIPVTAISEIGSELTKLQSPSTWWASTLGIGNRSSKYEPTYESAECSQVVYGWNPGSYYISTESNPCSSYFLVNLIQNSPAHRAEYSLEILSSPPAVVLYSRSGADLNVNRFEQDVLPWSAVLAICYRNTSGDLFTRRLDQGATRRCMLPLLQESLHNNLALGKLSFAEIVSSAGR